jgi:hypothetical protein
VGSSAPSAFITPTCTSGPGRPADDKAVQRHGAVVVEVLARRHHRNHHRRLGLAEELRHDGADLLQRLFEPRGRHRGGAVPEALQRIEPRGRQLRVLQQHVDERGRQEGVGDAVLLDEPEELAQLGPGHDHHLPAQRHHRQAQHAGRVRERRQREVGGPALEGVAHQGQRRHRLEVAPRQHHALGLAGGAAGAGDHGHVVDHGNVDGGVACTVEPLLQ